MSKATPDHSTEIPPLTADLPSAESSELLSEVRALAFGRRSYSWVCRQLKNRPAGCLEREWAAYPGREILIRDTVSELVMVEFSWPNNLYLPRDPCKVLFWEHSSSCGIDNAISNIIYVLGLSVPTTTQSWVFDRLLAIDYGDLISGIAALPRVEAE